MHKLIGWAVPDLAFSSTQGSPIRLTALPRPAVLYLYPWTGRPGRPNPPNWDDIPGAHGSTPEAEGFRDTYAKFQALGVDIFGLSSQDTAYQKEFAARLKLPFALLSDEPLSLRKALQLPVFETGGVTFLERLTLIVRDHTIVQVFHPVANPAAHAADVLAWFNAPRARV